MIALDGKMRETDVADTETIKTLGRIYYIFTARILHPCLQLKIIRTGNVL